MYIKSNCYSDCRTMPSFSYCCYKYVIIIIHQTLYEKCD